MDRMSWGVAKTIASTSTQGGVLCPGLSHDAPLGQVGEIATKREVSDR
jgi:hypothetical protein